MRQLQDQRSLLQTEQQQERTGVNNNRTEGAQGEQPVNNNEESNNNNQNSEARPGETQAANSARHNFRPLRRMNQYDDLVQRLTAEMENELRERDSDGDDEGGIKDFDTRMMLMDMNK